jgi:hypothetical protein
MPHAQQHGMYGILEPGPCPYSWLASLTLASYLVRLLRYKMGCTGGFQLALPLVQALKRVPALVPARQGQRAERQD